MNVEKKIKVQQDIIERQNKEIEVLREENKELKLQLEFEKNKPQEGYNSAKSLIVKLENYIQEYETLLQETKEAKAFYDKTNKDLLKIKGKYEKELNKCISSIKKYV